MHQRIAPEGLSDIMVEMEEEITERVLIVDDEPFNLIVLEGMLNMLGINEVKTAYNGQQALEILERYPIDAVLTDNNMPEMNGMELASRIRQLQHQGALKESLLIIMISGDTQVKSELLDECLSKPFNQ